MPQGDSNKSADFLSATPLFALCSQGLRNLLVKFYQNGGENARSEAEAAVQKSQDQYEKMLRVNPAFEKAEKELRQLRQTAIHLAHTAKITYQQFKQIQDHEHEMADGENLLKILAK